MAKNAKGDSKEPVKLYTIELSGPQMKQLQAYCASQMWIEYKVDYALFAFKGDKVNIVAYESGKLVVQGRKTEEFVSFVLETEITKQPKLGYDEVNHPEWFEPHAGLDESGKGDLFGPVVSACVIADSDMIRKWVESGIRDSKQIKSDESILKFDAIIRSTQGVAVKTTCAGMRKYNELYVKFGSNLNRFLAWLHATSLKEALKVKQVSWGMLDQFSKAPLVQNYFKDSEFDLRMQTKAEEDPVVGAASIVARAEYVRKMNKLSEKAGEELRKGASGEVKAQAKRLIEKFGGEELGDYAKLHFKTAYEALGIPMLTKK